MGWILTSLERLAEVTQNEQNWELEEQHLYEKKDWLWSFNLLGPGAAVWNGFGIVPLPNLNALQDLSSTLWVHGLVSLFFFFFACFPPKQPCLVLHGKSSWPSYPLGPPAQAWPLPQYLHSTPKEEILSAFRHWGEWNLVQRKQKETVFRFPFLKKDVQASFTLLFPMNTVGLRRRAEKKGELGPTLVLNPRQVPNRYEFHFPLLIAGQLYVTIPIFY